VRLADSRWLTDENVHPEVLTYLRGRGLDVLDVRERGWLKHLPEPERRVQG
jgi:hypothetical protein